MTEVLVERRDHALLITLNRPEVKNALHDEMYDPIIDALDQASGDPSIRSVIFTGAGDAFCSGADTRRIAKREGVFEGESAPMTRISYSHGVQRMSQAFFRCEAPIIAAVNGPALGLGFDLTIQCDIRIAAEPAVFSEAFVTFGLIPGDGGFWHLPRIVGYSRAVEMTITGRRIGAATALEWGLVSQVVPAGASLEAALELADEIAARSPHTVRLSKRLLRHAAEAPFQTALDMGAMAQAVLTGSYDQREATAAMVARRPGDFQGR